MTGDLIPSDVVILDLLRKRDAMSVTALATTLEVTATAVRQRLTRLLAQGYIQRETTKAGRGRPSHRYSLTNKGRRKTGANFGDLAMALWQEMRAIQDPDVRRGLLQRISKRLASLYSEQVNGDTVTERMDALVDLMGDRQIPFEVVPFDGAMGDADDVVSSRGRPEKSMAMKSPAFKPLPVLHALACPYPELAEMDRSVCAMERVFLSEVLNADVRLDRCRLDGETCCTFEVKQRAQDESQPCVTRER